MADVRNRWPRAEAFEERPLNVVQRSSCLVLFLEGLLLRKPVFGLLVHDLWEGWLVVVRCCHGERVLQCFRELKSPVKETKCSGQVIKGPPVRAW